MTTSAGQPAALCDGGSLDCNSGLLIAIRRALNGIRVGDILEIRSQAPSVGIDLPAWCDLAGHRLEHTIRHGETARYFVRKGRQGHGSTNS
jgi:TusA-related sulfurtransferase